MHHGFSHVTIKVEEIDWDKLLTEAKGDRQRQRIEAQMGDRSAKVATDAVDAEATADATPPPPPPNEKKE
jgi:hypothetical protein